MDDSTSSCAIDGLTIFCKRFTGDSDAYANVNAEEVDALYQSIKEGEASSKDLERVSTLSTLWASIVRVALSIHLDQLTDLAQLDFSNLPEDVSRFLGAFMSTVDVIVDTNPKNVDEVVNSLEQIFVPPELHNQTQAKGDLISQLVRNYKDWFNYSYMFNRRTGRHPKSSFDRINRHFQSLLLNTTGQQSTSLSKSITVDSNDDTYKDDDDDYGEEDTLGDSFAQENFPSISAPHVAPLNPFSAETYALPVTSSTVPSNVHSTPRRADDIMVSPLDSPNLMYDHSSQDLIPMVPNGASIVQSYYNSSSHNNAEASRNSNWGAIEEDEDESDADSSFFVAKKINKRPTRMRMSASSDDGAKRGTKKKMTRRRAGDQSQDTYRMHGLDDSDLLPSRADSTADRNSNRLNKSVTFADDHNFQLNTSQEWDLGKSLPRLEDSIEVEDMSAVSSPQRKRIVLSSVDVSSSNDLVKGFSTDELSPTNNTRKSIAGRPISDNKAILSDDSFSSGNQRPTLQRRASESSLELSDKERDSRAHSGSDKVISNPQPQQSSSRAQPQRVDAWAKSGSTSSNRIGRSKLSDDDSDADGSDRDPMAARRYKNPLDATLEEEEYRNQLRGQPPSPSTSSKSRKGDGAAMTGRSALAVLSPAVKIPSIQASPHRYANSEASQQHSDSEMSSSVFGSMMISSASPSLNQTDLSVQSINNSRVGNDSGRKEAMQRLQRNIAKHKANRHHMNDRAVPSPSTAPPPRTDNDWLEPLSRNSEEFFRVVGDSRSIFRHSQEGVLTSMTCKPGRGDSTVRHAHGLDTEMTVSPPFHRHRPSDRSVRDSPTRNPPSQLVLQKRTTHVLPEAFELAKGRPRRAMPSAPSHQSKPITNDPPLSMDVDLTRPLGVSQATSPILRASIRSSAAPPRLDTNSSMALQPSITAVRQDSLSRTSAQLIQSIAQSVQSVFDKPFQELPMNMDIPELSEFALTTGVIMEGFLNKRSSTFGLWQKNYFVLRESDTHFCEFAIFGSAVESAWGWVPLRLKTLIPIRDITSADTVGSTSANGKEFQIKFVPRTTQSTAGGFFKMFSRSKSTPSSAPASDADDNASDTGSVASEHNYGSKIQQLSLQADCPELRLFWVTMINKAVKAYIEYDE